MIYNFIKKEYYMNDNEKLKPINEAPKDGSKIILKMPLGFTQAWFHIPSQVWICNDGEYVVNIDDPYIEGWIPV